MKYDYEIIVIIYDMLKHYNYIRLLDLSEAITACAFRELH